MSLFDIIKYNIYLDNESRVHHHGVPRHFIDKWRYEAYSMGTQTLCNQEGVRRLKQIIIEYEEENESI
jgi:hypothetical protein